jgi:hypothetical protein
MKKFSEIIQRRRYDHLIVRAASDLENRHSYELTDDLGLIVIVCPSTVD